jgi:formylglycine-generating enzyme required for sulfatase activity
MPDTDKILNDETAEAAPLEPEMVLIPAGEFMMGSQRRRTPTFEDPIEEAAYSSGWEGPQHLANLPDYSLALTPVTHAQYGVFLEQTGYELPKRWRSTNVPRGRDDMPIMYVTWYDALAYCRWLA